MPILASSGARATAAIVGVVASGVGLALYNEVNRLQSRYDRSHTRAKLLNQEVPKFQKLEAQEVKARKAQQSA